MQTSAACDWLSKHWDTHSRGFRLIQRTQRCQHRYVPTRFFGSFSDLVPRPSRPSLQARDNEGVHASISTSKTIDCLFVHSPLEVNFTKLNRPKNLLKLENGVDNALNATTYCAQRTISKVKLATICGFINDGYFCLSAFVIKLWFQFQFFRWKPHGVESLARTNFYEGITLAWIHAKNILNLSALSLFPWTPLLYWI